VPLRRSPGTLLAIALLALLPLLIAVPGALAAQTLAQDPQAPLEAAEPREPGSELRIWLMTMGPGDAVWERFGHNALRIVDMERGTDLSYNWGIFDFQQVDFIPRFLRGEMLYTMAPFPTGRMAASYGAANREVLVQELNLTPAERVELRDFVEWNALPENRDYFYDYFLDNCSTRVRDVLDRVLGGQLGERFRNEPTGTSYRTHTRRLTQVDPLLYTGMDFLLGSPGDEPISVWEEMFLPMTLRDAIREFEIVDAAGVSRPLVLSEQVLIPTTRDAEVAVPPRWSPWYLGLGVVLGALLLGLGRGMAPRGDSPSPVVLRLGFGVFAFGWSVLAGVGGLLLVLVLFTDHHFMYWNESILQFNPLSLAVAALLIPAAVRGRASSTLVGLAWVVVGLSLLGVLVALLPLTPQQNTIFILLSLPVHLGLALGISGGRNRAAAPR
jgi:hypothetical protein